MNIDNLSSILSGKWKQISGYAKATWGDLTDDELAQIAGNKDMLMGKLQEKYGWTKEEVESNLGDFYNSIKDKISDSLSTDSDEEKDPVKDVKEVADNATERTKEVTDDAESLWDKLVSKVKETYNDFMDEDMKDIKKDSDALLEKIALKYNITKEEAREKFSDYIK